MHQKEFILWLTSNFLIILSHFLIQGYKVCNYTFFINLYFKGFYAVTAVTLKFSGWDIGGGR